MPTTNHVSVIAALGVKFMEYNHAYLEEGGGMLAIENMVILARTALIMLPAGQMPGAQRAFDNFIQRAIEMAAAEEDGATSARYGMAHDTMDAARVRAAEMFRAFADVG